MIIDYDAASDTLDSGGDEYIAENSDVIIGYDAASDTLDGGSGSDA